MTGHGKRVRPPLYHSWMAMRRCCGLAKGLTPYQLSHYIGIAVCPEWKDYKTFEDWGVSHGWQKGLHLTRRDKAKDFCPENCFWATLAEANGYRSSVRRLPDGRSARDVIGRRNLGRDRVEHNRVAGRLFGWYTDRYPVRWSADNALAPKCTSAHMARRVRAELARMRGREAGTETETETGVDSLTKGDME